MKKIHTETLLPLLITVSTLSAISAAGGSAPLLVQFATGSLLIHLALRGSRLRQDLLRGLDSVCAMIRLPQLPPTRVPVAVVSDSREQALQDEMRRRTAAARSNW